MLRIFVGLALPPALRQRLAGLAAGIPGARWTSPENLHLTLRFIGEVDEGTAFAVDDRLSAIRAPAFDLEIGGVGTFDGPRRAFTLWAGVARCQALIHLHEKVESAVVRAGIKAEGRRYQPHITLARVKDPPLSRLQDYIAGNNLLKDSLRVNAFLLFSSHLGHGEPVYRVEAEYPLT